MLPTAFHSAAVVAPKSTLAEHKTMQPRETTTQETIERTAYPA